MNILQQWHIADLNPGVCVGPDQWLQSKQTPAVTSYNPTNEQALAAVQGCSESELEQLIASAQAAFHTWRRVPAPKRGEVVRQIADVLRARKQHLAELITY